MERPKFYEISAHSSEVMYFGSNLPVTNFVDHVISYNIAEDTISQKWTRWSPEGLEIGEIGEIDEFGRYSALTTTWCSLGNNFHQQYCSLRYRKHI